MKITRYAILSVLMALLLAPGRGWAGKEGKAPAGEAGDSGAKVVCEGEAGRGLGYEACPPGEECPATLGPIVTDTAVPIDKGKFAIQPTFGYTFVTDVFTRNWRRISAGGNYRSLEVPVKFTYGLIKNLEVYAVVPFIHNVAWDVNEPGQKGNTSSRFSGLGDINLTFKCRLVEETKQIPTVSAVFTVKFPTGHFKNFHPGRLGTDILGSGYYGFPGGFNISKWLEPFIFYANNLIHHGDGF